MVAAASITPYFSNSKTSVYTLQALIGVMVTVFPPGMAAISLGLVGRKRLPARAGRNEACFHAGNVTAAGIAAIANSLWGTIGIFCGVAIMAISSAVSAMMIRESEIDHDLCGEPTPIRASRTWFLGSKSFAIAASVMRHLPPRMPVSRSAEFAGAAGREVIEILKRTRGRAFVLFTSYATLRAVQAMAEMALDYPIFVQGKIPRSLLLKRFRETPHSVLLATSSFWQGVDVVGEALSCVIIDKLPFASPGEPVMAARIRLSAPAAASRSAPSTRCRWPFWRYGRASAD